MTSRPYPGPRAAVAPAARGSGPTPYRVLVTGSRTWKGHELIHADLDTVLAAHPDMVLIHGACRQGADGIADRWAAIRGLPDHQVERHPAQWRRHRGAGFRRNTEMVQTGADLCLAYIALCRKDGCDKPMPHGSHGAEHCARQAHLAGIPVHPHRTWKTSPDPEQLTLGEAP